MASENVATIERIFELVNRGEIERAIEQLPPDDDFEVDFSRSINPDFGGEVHHTRDELRQQLERFTEAWEEMEFYVDEYIEVGDKVVRVGGVRGRGQGSGVDVVARGAQLWEFRAGQPVAMRQFQSKDEALAAAKGE